MKVNINEKIARALVEDLKLAATAPGAFGRRVKGDDHRAARQILVVARREQRCDAFVVADPFPPTQRRFSRYENQKQICGKTFDIPPISLYAVDVA